MNPEKIKSQKELATGENHGVEATSKRLEEGGAEWNQGRDRKGKFADKRLEATTDQVSLARKEMELDDLYKQEKHAHGKKREDLVVEILQKEQEIRDIESAAYNIEGKGEGEVSPEEADSSHEEVIDQEEGEPENKNKNLTGSPEADDYIDVMGGDLGDSNIDNQKEDQGKQEREAGVAAAEDHEFLMGEGSAEKPAENLEGEAKEGSEPEAPEVEVISPEVQEKIKEMPPTTRSLVERVYGILGVKTLIGKMKVAYSQFFINKDEDKIRKMEDEVDGIDKEMRENKEAQEKAKNLIEGFLKTINKSPKKIESQQRELIKEAAALEKERDGFSKKMDELREKINLRKEKRNEVAGHFHEIYKEKLAPVGENIEGLEADILDLELIVGSEQEEYDKFLSATAELKSETEKYMSSTGMSGWDTRRQLAVLRKAEKEPDSLRNKKKELEAAKKSLAKMKGKESSLKDKEKFFDKILKEEAFAQEVSKAKDFEELFKVIDKDKSVKGGVNYSSEQLKRTIDSVRKGDKHLMHITRSGGLRSKVEELLEDEKKS